MPLQATSGAASYDAFGGGVAVVPNYIEEVFATHLYTGNGSTQTITNGIDLAGKGGLVWTKNRTSANFHNLEDTVRGVNKVLFSNSTSAQAIYTDNITAFNANGYSLGADQTGDQVNTSGQNYVSWTFREQPKFFDVVTWTGDGVTGRQIPHNLGSVPGCIIIKRTDTTAVWTIFHAGLSGGITGSRILFDTAAATAGSNITAVDASTFTVISTGVNNIGGTYVAYLFAHNAGGFGLTGTDNVISCGSFTYNATSGTTVNLGFEPQFIIGKKANAIGQWAIADNMRGMPAPPSGGSGCAQLYANLSTAESDGSTWYRPTSTGFYVDPAFAATGDTFIYIAIRRGPMKVPTTGTSVFSPIARAGTGSAVNNGSPITVDASLTAVRDIDGQTKSIFASRLTGSGQFLVTSNTANEQTSSLFFPSDAFAQQTGFRVATTASVNANGYNYIDWAFKRAPGFFDEVCYTGTGTTSRNNSHNLAVVPELMIVKERNFGGTNWRVYSSALGNTKEVYINQTNASTTTTSWASTTPTASVFTVGVSGGAGPNDSGSTYVAYLFASCPGVSKVGSYTGTGTTQTINCGFTAGSRFVLIKRTDSTGDWYVWDSARGMIPANDPYLLLNSTAAEVTNTDFIDTAATGFEISSTAPAAINASGGTFIFLAIA